MQSMSEISALRADGVSDDSARYKRGALREPSSTTEAALFGLNAAGDILWAPSLFVGTRGTPGSDTEPAVTLEGCTPNADSIAKPRGFTGGIDTLGGIVRAAGSHH